MYKINPCHTPILALFPQKARNLSGQAIRPKGQGPRHMDKVQGTRSKAHGQGTRSKVQGTRYLDEAKGKVMVHESRLTSHDSLKKEIALNS